MSIKLTDELARQLHTYLSANINTQVAAVDTLFSDAIDLTPFGASEIRYDDPRDGARTVVPVLNIVCINGRMTDWRQNSARPMMRFMFWITCRDQDAQVLRRKLYRYLLALWNTLVAGHFASSIDWSMVGEPEFDYSETYGSEAVLYADSRLIAEFTTLEVAP